MANRVAACVCRSVVIQRDGVDVAYPARRLHLHFRARRAHLEGSPTISSHSKLALFRRGRGVSAFAVSGSGLYLEITAGVVTEPLGAGPEYSSSGDAILVQTSGS